MRAADRAAAANASDIKPPAIFVIGKVVAHAEALADIVPRPLRGLRLALFAPGGELGEALQAAGANLLLAPEPLTNAARLVIGSASLAGFVVRTLRELDALERERQAHGVLARATLWCTGAALAASARARSWSDVQEIDGSSPAHAIAQLGAALAAAL